MIWNYIKIAWRNLRKNKLTSIINLFGLTVGLICCFLILAFVLHEVSYDRSHSKADKIFRVERNFIDPGTDIPRLQLASVAPPLAPLLENDFREVLKATRLHSNGTTTLHYEEKRFKERKVYFADENFFHVFDVDLIRGNPDFNDPFSIMLTEEIAKKYFGDEDPINKTISIDNQFEFKVTGVYKAFPNTSHFHPNILLSFNTLKDPQIYGQEYLSTRWDKNNFYTYLLLSDNHDPKLLESQFPSFLDRHLPTRGRNYKKPSELNSLEITALTDIHLHSQKSQELEKNGNIEQVQIFSAVALFILLIASINYMNLSTALSVLRAKEIGVRKTLGAGKNMLIAQFLTESILLTYTAAILAFALSWITFPFVDIIFGLNLSLNILFRWEILLPILILPLFIGILSGIYPALFLSSFQPVKVLKGFAKYKGERLNFRQVLVVTQFSISIILIIGMLVIYQQMQYLHEKEPGYDRDQVITFSQTAAIADNYSGFRNELLSSANINEIGRSSRIPTGQLLDGLDMSIHRNNELIPVKDNFRYVQIDNHFLSTYGIKLLSGREFSSAFGSDSLAFMINQAAVRKMKLNSVEDAVGQEIEYGGRKGRIVGVTNDFHFESMHQPIKPIVFYNAPSGYRKISVKISGENVVSALAHLKKIASTFDPETPFEYSFLDDTFSQLYQSEQRQGYLFTVFVCMAIAIACLGLFGLSVFTTNRRLKEISVRKLLGANISTIVALLSKDFIKLVLLASVIAFPIAFFLMNMWLQDFAYRIEIHWWIFAVAGITALFISFITVSLQAIKAAVANPIKSLRTE